VKRPLSLLLALALTLVGVVVAPTAALAGDAFPARIDLPDGFAPEGITTGRGTTVYVGSLAGGAIWRGDVRTGDGAILVDPVEDGVAVGIDYDRRADRLWVAGGDTGEVRVYDARTGELLETYTFTAGFLNDVVVTRDAVYVTDSLIQQLAVIPLGSGGSLPAPDEATTLALTGDLEYTTGFNVNGIEATGGYLVLVQSNTGRLFRADPTDGTTIAIDTGGYSVSFGDGLELRGRTLFVVRNQLGIVARLRLGPRLASARLLSEIESDDVDVPTTGTIAAGRLYVVNARFGTPVTPETTYWITRLPTR
jgi:hypothetical protein